MSTSDVIIIPGVYIHHPPPWNVICTSIPPPKAEKLSYQLTWTSSLQKALFTLNETRSRRELRVYRGERRAQSALISGHVHLWGMTRSHEKHPSFNGKKSLKSLKALAGYTATSASDLLQWWGPYELVNKLFSHWWWVVLMHRSYFKVVDGGDIHQK